MAFPQGLYPFIQNPAILRAAALLPAAGAYDPAPTSAACAGSKSMALFIAYTRGGAAGSFEYKIEVSPFSSNRAGVANWYQLSLEGTPVVVTGADTQRLIQAYTSLYKAVGAGEEAFVISLDLSRVSVERIRLAAREVGAAATPGTLSVVGIFYP